MLNLGSPLVAQAAIIGTLQAVESQHRAADLATVNAALARDQVRTQFGAMGVDADAGRGPRCGDDRCGAAHAWPARCEDLPAGADALAIIGIVFLVLLILEAVGVIDIFKKFPVSAALGRAGARDR